MNDRIFERMKKLKELALKGLGAERESAQALLDELMVKYNITEADLDQEVVDLHYFRFSKTTIEERLLGQVIYKVTGSSQFYSVSSTSSGRKIKELATYCTEAQKVEIEFLFDFYKTLWYKEEDYFFRAFVQKHKIFGINIDENTNASKELTWDEYMKITKMQNGISDASPILRIEGTNV